MESSNDHESLLRDAVTGNGEALGELFERHRQRLAKMIRLRLDRRLKSRVNPSDVLQEAFLEASQRLREYLDHPEVPFFVWLRFLAGQKVAQVHRHHLGTQCRDVHREFHSIHQPIPAVCSAILAARLVGKLTSPSIAVHKSEMRRRLYEVLNSMEPIDREILAMRHFEHLSNLEAAAILGLSPTAASNRYVRALVRLRSMFDKDRQSDLNDGSD